MSFDPHSLSQVDKDGVVTKAEFHGLLHGDEM
jgi:hypothetical protein